PGGICFACAHCCGEAILVSRDRRELCAVSSWGVRLLFLAAAENDCLFLSRHREPGMGADVDRAAGLFFRDAVPYRIRFGVGIASGRAGTGQIWIDHLQIHGAHPAIRSGADLHYGDNHYTHAGHFDLDRTGAADVSALRELYLDRLAHGAPPVETG